MNSWLLSFSLYCTCALTHTLKHTQDASYKYEPMASSRYHESAPDLQAGLSIRNLVKVYDDDNVFSACRKVSPLLSNSVDVVFSARFRSFLQYIIMRSILLHCLLELV